MASGSGDEQYQPQDAIKAAINGTMVVGSAGVLVSAVQNTLAKRNLSGWGVVTRTGGTIAVFAAMGGTYEFARLATANLRERDDSLNPAVGGFVAGSVLGLRFGTTPAVLGLGTLTAVVLGASHFVGGPLGRKRQDQEMDEFERKEFMRKNRRRPKEETLAELGEGRGIYGPGYEERRRIRMKEKYGIDIPAKS